MFDGCHLFNNHLVHVVDQVYSGEETELLGILAALGPFAFSKFVYDAYSKFVIVLAVTIKTDHFKNSITNSSFLLNHDLINVFLFTIMLTQCVPNTLDLFYILSTS